jgi:hypothetical protein
MFLVGARYDNLPGPSVTFTCPVCRSGPAQGTSYEQTETVLFLLFVPTSQTHTTFVVCGNCRTRLVTRMTLAELRQCVGEDISRFVAYRVSIVFKTLSVCAILCCWAPILGTTLAGVALGGTRKTRSLWRSLAIIALVVSLIPDVVLVLGLII